MKAEDTDNIAPPDILQIIEHNEPAKVGALIVVSWKETWGVHGLLKTDGAPQPISVPWSHVEPTGGKAVIDGAGKRYAPAEPTLKQDRKSVV